MSGGGGCSGPTGCALGSSYTFSESTSTIVTINAENAAGSWTDMDTTTSAMAISYTPYLIGSFGAPPYTGIGNTYISHTWTVPLQTVLNIPAAGSYIVDLDVTGISGACTLVVLQP